MVHVLISRLDHEVPLPAYARPGDAGADLMTTVDVVLEPGERSMVPTGVAIALPAGYAGFVHPRSGLAARCGVTVVNAPGTIDAGYRGEIKVLLINLDPSHPARLKRGDRVAQLVFNTSNPPGSSRSNGCRARSAERLATVQREDSLP